MALVKFGNGVASISGKIDGTVFSRVRGGAVARGWTNPIKAPTALQISYRTAFAAIVAEWANLSASERTAWNAQALTAERQNRLGETYVPSGRQLFMELNKNLSLVGSALIQSPPLSWIKPAPPALLAGEGTAAAGVISALTIDITAPSPDPMGKYIVEMTPAFSPVTKTNVQNLYRLIYYGVAGASIDVLSLYDSIFGSAANTGDGILMRASTVDPQGNRSSFIEAKFVLTV